MHSLHSIIFILTVFFALPNNMMAQKPTGAQMEDALFACLWKKINKEDISHDRVVGNSLQRDPSDHTRAFDSNTGRNFAYDKNKQAWIDTKTGENITSANLEDALFCCLWKKINKEDISHDRVVGNSLQRDPSDHTRAFDSNTGRNFVYDKSIPAWIDTKTGECICPKCSATAAIKDSAKKTALKENTSINKYVFLGLSTGFEDSKPKRFNTYGVNISYAHFGAANVGLTGDGGIYFGANSGVDYTKIQLHGGISFHPNVNTDNKILFIPHVLAGITNIKSKYTGVSNSSTNFSALAGTDIYFPLSNKTGIDIRVDYNPALPSGGVKSNFRLGAGIGIK